MSERLGYRPELDGLRALAVVAVIAFHVNFPAWLPGGYIGVDVFFVLSGFLITTLLWQAHRDERAGFRGFYVRRIARLAPALLLTVAVVTPLGFVMQPVGIEYAKNTAWGSFAALTYLSGWWRSFTNNDLGHMGHTWSLSVEEWFYLAWPLLFAALWAGATSRTVRRVAVITAVAVAYQAAGVALNVSPQHLYNGPDFRASQLLIGCLLGVVLAAGWMGRSRIDGVLFVAAGVLLVALAAFGPAGETRKSAALATLVALTSAIVIRHLFLRPGGVGAKVLRSRPVVWVGVRSYGLYLWHFPLIGLIGALSLSRAKTAGAAVVSTVLIAAVSYRFVEDPARRAIRRRWSGPRVVEQQVAAA